MSRSRWVTITICLPLIAGLPAHRQAIAERAMPVRTRGKVLEPGPADPDVTASPSWSTEGDQSHAWFGRSVRSAGDVNGDGYDDVVVGAYRFDEGQRDEGKAFLYEGSTDGLATTPAWTAQGDQGGARFAREAGTAGDVNGDGYDDVVVGAYRYDDGEVEEGRAYLYLGSADGLGITPAWTAEGDQPGAHFGFSIATAGDVNGDGYDDVIVGAYRFDEGETDEGKAFLYEGSADGLTSSPVWTAESDQTRAYFGREVRTAGDVNGDGFDDVIVGAYRYDDDQTDEGRAFVYQGSSSGLGVLPSWTAESDQANSRFGFAVGTAGDVNGDGCDEVVVGAPRYDDGQVDEGAAFVYDGSTNGLSAAANWIQESEQTGANYARAVATAGDVNADGYDDVVIGDPNYDGLARDDGQGLVYEGSSGGLTLAASWTAEVDQRAVYFGRSVATAGDVNADGYDDVVVGGPRYDDGQVDEGGAFEHDSPLSGSSLASSGSDISADWMVESDQQGARLGVSVAGAGDVNGDGYMEVIVGAYRYSEGQTEEGKAFLYEGTGGGLGTTPSWTAQSDTPEARFGFAVAGAGDVNGDGFDDAIVGAPTDSNGQVDEGRAFVYYGSAGGLNSSPDWAAESDQAHAHFGDSVAGAGDVNGDGFADVIVGAPNYDAGNPKEGKAFLYEGSPSGPSATPDWIAEGGQPWASLGYAVAAAGDVNGDGFGDVVVGVPRYDSGQYDEGRVYVYEGSAVGLSPIPNWEAESNHAGAAFGRDVGSAGDVNGDGYDDVIVGAPRYNHATTEEGKAYVFSGSPTGLSREPVWAVLGDQVGAHFGTSAATAGDVNGDGFDDVVVGAARYDDPEQDEGRVFVYHGSAAGLLTTSQWTAEGDQAGARFGISAGTSGDVDGDGYDDVVVGAYFFDDGQVDEGAAFAYLGSPTR